MATSSIFAPFIIDDPESVSKLLEALNDDALSPKEPALSKNAPWEHMLNAQQLIERKKQRELSKHA